eukprot:7179532-Prymnesium_polylepis.1
MIQVHHQNPCVTSTIQTAQTTLSTLTWARQTSRATDQLLAGQLSAGRCAPSHRPSDGRWQWWHSESR